ncbi:MAG: ATP-dependent helicase [Candidatus Adiutrix sp.]|jgi:DNA helicase-2/ATP-dependent DNA helicase PcrA|nr:ATP-dependent helicase [Candidatus Adiutrix sp.]
MNFMAKLGASLNSSQLAAATYEGGPLLIVAGAGSGKTRTLVHRVAYLVDRGVPPSAILLLTFTRKAAQEMLGRATALVGARATQVSGGTFHALANLLIRPEAHRLGYPAGFAIMDQDDAESLISRIRNDLPEVKRYKRFPQKGAILSILSQAVNKDRPLLETITDSFPHFLEFAPFIDQIGQTYRAHKLENALMDFDDLLVGLETILRQDEEVRRRLAARYDYILVDEYQDTNPIQARLTALLGRDHLRVTAVGDDAQSIYAFRGASFRNIMDFPKIFPGSRIIKLEENYRSQEPIVSLANQIMAQAREKYDKKLVAIRGTGEPPQLTPVADQSDEAGWVADRLERLMAEGLELKNMAVLFRASAHSFELEAELVRRRLPYTKYGGRKFFELAHIKDFLAFLRVCVNPADGLSLRRVLALTPGIGARGAEALAEWVGGRREQLTSLASAPVRPQALKNLVPLAALLADIAPEGTDMAHRLKGAFDFYQPRLRDIYPDDWPDRQNDLKEILRLSETQGNLRAFLDDLTLDPPNQKQTDPEKNNPGLTLSTVHSAKGLEWPVVFIISAVEGRFPPPYAVRSAAEVEEERRLMYVAVTRARDRLFILMPLGIIDYNTSQLGGPSRFLAGLPAAAEAGLRPRPNELLNSGANLEYNQRNRPLSLPARPVAVGQRVSHPVYGAGRVQTVDGPEVTIDFDHFGLKKVRLQYAKLTSL